MEGLGCRSLVMRGCGTTEGSSKFFITRGPRPPVVARNPGASPAIVGQCGASRRKSGGVRLQGGGWRLLVLGDVEL